MKSTEGIFNYDSIESDSGGNDVGSNPERYSELYKELAGLIGDSAVRKLWQAYGGLTITFPKRLYSKEYTRQFIHENMDTMKPTQIAKECQLSDRRVRQIIKELHIEDKDSINKKEGKL